MPYDKSAIRVGVRLEGGPQPAMTRDHPVSPVIYGQLPKRPASPRTSLAEIEERLVAARKRLAEIAAMVRKR